MRITLAVLVLPAFVTALAAQQPARQGPPADQASRQSQAKETELWEPVPVLVTPGATAGAPPSDAIVLFNGRNMDGWVLAKDGTTPAAWKVEDGVLTVDKTNGTIQTRRLFKNYQMHIEWRIPVQITGADQARGNSGVFLVSTGPGDAGYELQVLDSYENKTYVNGQAGSVYKQASPLVNASRKPGEWQVYDIVWIAPVFNADGSLKTPAYLTTLHNNVLIQDHFELKGETAFIGKPFYKAYGPGAPIKLQSHGDPSPPISFRNIWVRELP